MKKITVILTALAIGFFVTTGCATKGHLEGKCVDDLSDVFNENGTLVSHDLSFLPKFDDKNEALASLSETVAREIGIELKERLRNRGHRFMPKAETLVEFTISLEEHRLYPEDERFLWRTYTATADVQISANKKNAGTMLKRTFKVDGRTLGEEDVYFVYESDALAPVQNRLQEQIDAWLEEVLTSGNASISNNQ